MFSVNLSTLIHDIKEMVIPHGQRNEKALHMVFDVSLRRDYSTNFCRREFLHFLMYSPYGSTVHTFFARQEFGSLYETKMEDLDWENISNHDSCWRSAIGDRIHSVSMEMANQINAMAADDGMEKIAPINMKQNTWFVGWGRNAWKLIDLEVRKVGDYKYEPVFK